MLSSLALRGRQSPWICAQCRKNITARPSSTFTTARLRKFSTTYIHNNASINANESSDPKTADLESPATTPPITTRPSPSRTPSEPIDDEGTTASIVSQLLNKATEDALYPSQRNVFDLDITKLPTKWATNSFLRPIIRETIRRGYPDIEDLTPIQAKLMAALSRRLHLTLADIPGTGKSFALATWMLNIDRSTRTATGHIEPTTTVLVLVPNPDLAMQYWTWITTILNNSQSEAIINNIPSFVQVLYRHPKDEEQKKLLKEHPNPHIIIGTPARVLDILAESTSTPYKLLDIERLKLVVVDEADSLFDFQAVRQTNPISLRPSRAATRPVPPAEQLLDYIFESRNKKLISPSRAKGELNYIQIVCTSSSISARHMRRWIEIEKRQWLSPYGRNASQVMAQEGVRLGFAPNLEPVKPGDLVSPIMAVLQRDISLPNTVLRKVHESVKHYIVGYDMESGFLRDPPMTKVEVKNALADYITTMAPYVNKKTKNRKLQQPGSEQDHKSDELQPTDIETKKLLGDDGYPETLSVPILEKLLIHDNWPQNVLVGLGNMASKAKFKQSCEAMGIRAEILSFEAWNARDGGSPIGRTDMHIASSSSAAAAKKTTKGREEEGGGWEGDRLRSRTTVWITDPISCAGLDTPGLTHAYIFHRVESTKDYIAYCGRVSRHPFADYKPINLPLATKEPDLVSTGPRIKDQPPHIGKVVSVVLEEHITPTEIRAEKLAEEEWLAQERLSRTRLPLLERKGSGYRYGKGEKVVRILTGEGSKRHEIGVPVLQIGSMFEKDAYLHEGIRREKIGCVIEKYFGDEEDRRILADLGDEDMDVEEWGPESEEGNEGFSESKEGREEIGIESNEEYQDELNTVRSEESQRLRAYDDDGISGNVAEEAKLPALSGKPLPPMLSPPLVPTALALLGKPLLLMLSPPSVPTVLALSGKPLPPMLSPPPVPTTLEEQSLAEPSSRSLPQPETIASPLPQIQLKPSEPLSSPEPQTAEPNSGPSSTPSLQPSPSLNLEPTELSSFIDPTSLHPPPCFPTAEDPTLTQQDLTEYHAAQKEVFEAYDELTKLMGQVWDNTPKEVKTAMAKAGEETVKWLEEEVKMQQQEEGEKEVVEGEGDMEGQLEEKGEKVKPKLENEDVMKAECPKIVEG